MKKEEGIKIRTYYMILFCLFLVAMPIIFLWHIEIGWEIKENVFFENGWFEVEVLKIYHIQLYSLIILNGFASGYILYGLINKKDS